MESEKFYEIKVEPSEILLRVRPREGGKGANLTDIQKELTELDISYRMDHLFDIYRRSSNEFETLTRRESTKFEIQVSIGKGGAEAHMTVVTPERGDDKLTPAKVKEALERAKVEKGILYDEIKAIMAGKFGTEPILIAKGQPAVQGQEGWIEFNPENEGDSTTAVEENRANYKEMHLVKGVEEGHLIGTIHPPTQGADGFDVRGKQLKGKDGKRAKYRLGANTRLSDDGTEIYASKGGFVVFAGDKISVEDVLNIPNVDSSSGNIRFSGVVRVHGQVEDGFSLEGTQGIDVAGTVGKAQLKSRGEIRVNGGAIGARIIAKSVTARFFSECEVKAGENVIAKEYVLHSIIQAGKVVRVIKPNEGFISGGIIQAGEAVWCAVLGSEASEESTRIEVGAEIHMRRDFERLSSQFSKGREQFDKIRKNLRVLQAQRERDGALTEQAASTFDKLAEAGQGLRGQLLESIDEYRRLFHTLAGDASDDGYVFVTDTANPGTRIQIKRFPHNITTPLQSCAFRISHGDLKVQDFGEVQRIYKIQHGKMPG